MLSVWIDLRVVHKGKVKNSKLQPKYFGVWPLRFSKKLKLNRLPTDCDIYSYNDSQNTAKFRAGRFSLPANMLSIFLLIIIHALPLPKGADGEGEIKNIYKKKNILAYGLWGSPLKWAARAWALP